MLYWLGVYGLTILAVLVPFILLYIVLTASWLVAAAVRYLARTFKSIPAARERLRLTHR